MINVSSEFLQKLYNDERDYKERIEITLKDGTELELTNPDIWQGSFAFEDAVGSDGTFTAVGSAIVNSFKFSINNIYENFSEYDFTDAVITAHVGLQVGNTIEELDKGAFTVQDAVYNGSIISITAYDNMSKFDRPYSESNLVYPTTALAIVQDACLVCGVTLAANSANFPNYNFPISEKPSGESTTFREVISWVATIACCFARCNTEGKLEFKWFDKQALDDNEFLDGGIFDGGTGNYVKPSMRTGDKFQDNGLTVEYTHDGWWHVYGTREDNSAIRFDLYEDVLDETSGSYTFRLETKGFTASQEPKIGYLCYPQEGQLVSWSSSVSPYTTNVYSLPILGLAFWQRTGSALPAYDGFVRFSVAKTIQEPYQSGDTADGGIFNPWETGYEYDSNLHDHGRIHILSSLYSSNIAVDDVVITQVAADIKVKSESSSNDLRHVTYGEDGYAICISNNDFITESNWETILGYIGDEIIGLRFRKVNLSHASNPSIEAGDIAYVYDRKGNRYQILITRTNFTVGSSQTTVCGADTPARNSAARFSEATKSYVELRKQIKVVDNPYAKALADLADAMQQPGGMYVTEVVQPDQSIITYQHNMPLLAESDKQIAITDIGMTFTSNGTDPNPTWYGSTVDGQVVASILNAAGVNAEWIRTGQLVVLDPSGNETFFADYATGIVRINATQFKVIVDNQSKTVQQITDDAINGIEIGNRNLIRGTSEDTNQYDKWAFLRSAVWKDGIIRLTPDTSGSYARRIIDYLPYGEYKNQEYVLSFDGKLVNPSSYDDTETNLITGTTGTTVKTSELNGTEYHILSSFYYFTEEGQTALTDNTEDFVTISFDYQLIGAEPAYGKEVFIYAQINFAQGNAPYIYVKPNESGHAVCTFKLTDAQASYVSTYRLRFRLRHTVEGAVMRITHPKVVIGTEETPWVPSPGEASYDSITMPNDVAVYLGLITPERNNKATNFLTASEYFSRKYIDLVQDYNWHRYSVVFTVPDDFNMGDSSVLVDSNFLQCQFALSGSDSAIDIRNIKLAKGNKSTDYSEAPEDLVEGTVIHYGSPDSITPTDYTLNEGDYLIDESTGQTYRWDADSEQWLLVTDYQESINEATDTLRTEINQTIDGVEIIVEQTSGDLNELKMHYRFDAEGETIGKSDSDKSIRLANDGINMMVDDEPVTRWNQDEMYTPVKVMVPVGGSLQLGDFVFQPRTNGNMSLFYVGED